MILSNSYDELMENLVLSDAAKSRILARVSSCSDSINTGTKRKIHHHYAAMAACMAVVAASGILISGYLHTDDMPDDLTVQPPPGVVGSIPNVSEVASLEELEAAVGFAIEELRELPFESYDTYFKVYQDSVAEITYRNDAQAVILRISPINPSNGTPDAADHSGDYTAYPNIQEMKLNGRTITMKGNESGFFLALWNDESYAYSVRVRDALKEEIWREMLAAYIEA